MRRIVWLERRVGDIAPWGFPYSDHPGHVAEVIGSAAREIDANDGIMSEDRLLWSIEELATSDVLRELVEHGLRAGGYVSWHPAGKCQMWARRDTAPNEAFEE
jgi:hypothetical protein